MWFKATGIRFVRVIGGYVSVGLAAAITAMAVHLPGYIRWGILILIALPTFVFAVSIICGVSLLYTVDELLSRFGPKRLALQAAARMEARVGKNPVEVPNEKKSQVAGVGNGA